MVVNEAKAQAKSDSDRTMKPDESIYHTCIQVYEGQCTLYILETLYTRP
jgi:hypothetical protein